MRTDFRSYYKLRSGVDCGTSNIHINIVYLINVSYFICLLMARVAENKCRKDDRVYFRAKHRKTQENADNMLDFAWPV